MKIQSLYIKNFKSIIELELKFTDNMYGLVGQNEVGKSNILQALSLFTIKPGISNDETKKLNKLLRLSTIEAIFEFHPTEMAMLGKIHPTVSHQNINYNSGVIRRIAIRLSDNLETADAYHLLPDDGARVDIDNIPNHELANKFRKKIDDLRPLVEYYEKEDFLLIPVNLQKEIEQNGTQSLPIEKLLRLGGIENIKDFIRLSPEDILQARELAAENINELLRKYYNTENGLQIKIESHDGVFTVMFKDVHPGINFMGDRSTGLQYFFSFLINKLYNQKFGRSNSIYLFDEPALTLHPKSQKKFIKLLEEVAQENLVLYTTHSPFCINRHKPTRIWVVERNKAKGTFVNHKPYQHNWRKLRASLGMDISDSFFYADKTLLVEGPEDRIYFSVLLNYFMQKGEISLNTDLLSIIDSGSLSNMPAMVQILVDENRPMFVLVDNDDSNALNRIRAKEKVVNNKYMLNVGTITDINSDAIAIEDLLPKDVYVAAVNNYLQFLLNEKSIALKKADVGFVQIEIGEGNKRSVLVAAEILKFYTDPEGKELDKKVPISKVGIAHEFEKLLEQPDDLGDAKAMAICLRLVEVVAKNLQIMNVR
ncbi:ATP-dependent endonuclease [Ferruginibacter sp. HRS2-29]|uniref:ATP-dependent nuclease n=2 Tax=Ferruginibacter sp. HRS2-29 TaxID=2487334 RepID=UPI0020CCF26E|nr:AAA family ATPase [Ferruginibacter sp. HRS2-29]MCP9751791.1 hypothetical protein [Ferruginibacter sp. HRS2-29]